MTRHEAGTVALEMLADGASSDEIKEYYKKTDKKVADWKGSFEDYLKGRDAVDEANAIKDADKQRQTKRRRQFMEDYLIKYHGDEEDEMMLWKLAHFGESTFPKSAR